MTSNRNRPVPGYGTGFDTANRKADPRAFLAWWTANSLLPVAIGRADALPATPEVRRAA